MTDSSLETNSGDGDFDVGSSVDELFGEFAQESLEGEADDGSSVGSPTETGDGADAGGEIEDQTAADVFSQLRASAENDTDEVLADESPADIIASADEPDAEPELDDDLRVDDDALADLLLTGRTKEKEFLWVESGSDDAASRAIEGDSDTEDELETITDADASTESLEDDGEDETRSDVGAEVDEAAVDAADDGELESNAADDAPATEETALALTDTDEETLPATTEDEQSSGFFGWLRSKLGGLF